MAEAPPAAREIRDEVPEATVVLAEVALGTVWNVRGNAGGETFVAQAAESLGLSLPAQPNASARGDATALLWQGPDSWLFVTGPDAARDDYESVRRAFQAAGGALFDVSASYVAWAVGGAAACRALSRCCPLDLHARAFPAGRAAQSMLGHINALYYKPDERPWFIVLVARSFAADAWTGLRAAAATDGCRVAPVFPFGGSAA